MNTQIRQFCVASNDLSDFHKSLNTLLGEGWIVVPNTMVGFGMSHEMSPESHFDDDKKLRRYTQANFLCVVEKIEPVAVQDDEEETDS